MRNIFLSVLVLCFFSSCTAILDLDPRERFVVVHGILVNKPRQVINLHYSSLLSEDEMLPIDDANVWVEEKNRDGTIGHIYEFKAVGNGQYEAWFKPQSETRYNLKVVVPGQSEITASTLYPTAGNFSDLRVFNESYCFDYASDIPLFLWVYGQVGNELQSGSKTVTYIAEQGDFADSFNETALQHVSGAHQHWRYLRYEFSLESIESIPFVEDYVHIGLKKTVSLLIYPDFGIRSLLSDDCYVEFCSVSEEYDCYLKEVVSFELKLDHIAGNDFSSLYDHHSVYTNVQNGIGIFGAVLREEIRPLCLSII